MADWSKPTITSNYVTFVDEVKARDVDAITLQKNALVNAPVSSIKMLRLTHPLMKFQEWDGSAFADKILDVSGGGTGLTSLASLGPILGLGTMAYQNANAVAITGGSLNAVQIHNPTIYGTVTQASGAYNLSGILSIYNVANPTTSFTVVTNQPGVYAGIVQHAGALNSSYGFLVRSGTSKVDICFNLENGAGTQNWLYVRGDGGMIFNGATLAIPVGVNRFVVA